MTIVSLDKVTIYGHVDQREKVLDALQSLGCLHLLNLNPAAVQPPAEGLVSVEVREALKFLHACPVRRADSKRTRGVDTAAIVSRTLENKRRQQSLSDERDNLGKAIEDLEPWGEFRIPTDLGPARLWFFVVPRREAKGMESVGVPFAIVAEQPDAMYLVAISPEEPTGVPGTRVELDPRPLSELRSRLDQVNETLDDLHWERVELTRWISLIERTLDETDDRAAREWAARLTLDGAEVFAVQGWAPVKAREAIQGVAHEHCLAVTFAEPVSADSPPTLLENSDRVAGAEGAVTFYITPAYQAWDPTPIMFFSFSLFFGMIMADAGYGLIMAIALALFWRKLGRTAEGIGFRNLLLAIVGVTIVFGAMAGSYFGLAPRPASLLARLQVLNFEDRGQMMGLSILIGVAHLTLANLIMAWRARRSPRVIGTLGWVMLMFGALMMAAGLLRTPGVPLLASLGKWVIAVGGIAILFFSSDRPLSSRRVSDWIGRLVDGFGAITGISKLFGDVLSYLRLFALGLASAQLAATFNDLAGDMSQIRGIGILLAALILIAGHGINLVLGLMGGVVHGLRLNCIEFFNWSLTEEGYPFRSFHRKVPL